MSKRNLSMLITAFVLLALVLTVSNAATAQAASRPESAWPYSGHLADLSGTPVDDGLYDFVFTLYASDKAEEALWSETQIGVSVKGGEFHTALGANVPLPPGLTDLSAYWLDVGVRGPGEQAFTPLSPRQSLASGPSAVNALSCPHSHFTDHFVGTTTAYGLSVDNQGTGDGLRAFSAATSSSYAAVWAVNTASSGSANGVYGSSPAGTGVYGKSTSGTGVWAQTDSATAMVGKATATTGNTRGVWGESASSSGIGVVGKATSATGNVTGVWGEMASSGQYARGVVGWATKTTGLNYGVWGQSESQNGIGVYGQANNASCAASLLSPNFCAGASGSSTKGNGVVGTTTGGVGVYAGTSGAGPAVKAETGAGGDLFQGWVGPAFSELKFKVSSAGNVYADGTFSSPAADMAELLPAAAGLEPGDVLVVGADGHLARSAQPNQASVVGVYSTQPAFVGGSGAEADLFDNVPLAVVGIVPVKVSAENGAIQPGDLLVAAALPGHAMRAPANPAPGTVIGKAMGSLESGTGMLKMLVMLR